MTNQIESYLLLAALLLSIGVFGLLERRNLIGILISIELILNSASINFLAANRFLIADKAVGQIFTLFIIGLAAAEATIALSIILLLYRRLSSINIEKVDHLKD